MQKFLSISRFISAVAKTDSKEQYNDCLDILYKILNNINSDLKLVGKNISETSIKAIAEAIKRNDSLVSLSIIDCGVNDVGAQAIAE